MLQSTLGETAVLNDQTILISGGLDDARGLLELNLKHRVGDIRPPVSGTGDDAMFTENEVTPSRFKGPFGKSQWI